MKTDGGRGERHPQASAFDSARQTRASYRAVHYNIKMIHYASTTQQGAFFARTPLATRTNREYLLLRPSRNHRQKATPSRAEHARICTATTTTNHHETLHPKHQNKTEPKKSVESCHRQQNQDSTVSYNSTVYLQTQSTDSWRRIYFSHNNRVRGCHTTHDTHALDRQQATISRAPVYQSPWVVHKPHRCFILRRDRTRSSTPSTISMATRHKGPSRALS